MHTVKNVRHFVISRRARRSRRRTFLGASRTEEAGAGGASTQRESTGTTAGGGGASRSSPALACATIVARLPAMPMRAVGESPRRSACAGRTRPREPASVDMARARAGARERGVRSCTRTLAVGRRRGAAATDAGRGREAARAKIASRFSRCAFRSGETRNPRLRRSSVCDSRNRLDRERSSSTCSPTLQKNANAALTRRSFRLRAHTRKV